MEDYNKIIESLQIKFPQVGVQTARDEVLGNSENGYEITEHEEYAVNAKSVVLKQSCLVENYYDIEDYMVLLHDGVLSIGDGTYKVENGDMLFIPGGKVTKVWYGADAEETRIDNEEFISNKENYFEFVEDASLVGKQANALSYVAFSVKVFDAISFFSSLDIPPFIIKDNPGLARIVKEVVVENLQENAGKFRMIKLKTEQIVVDIIRYILENGMFVEQIATKSTYFKDPRLIDIFKHIKEDLGGDLSNKKLAEVANVSEDYVGQYFKMLTGINPQDYIEYQRMEKAVNLLRTSKKSIREIGGEVGYKDTAYFCRRFKMMFGIPAGKMRRRASLMNVN